MKELSSNKKLILGIILLVLAMIIISLFSYRPFLNLQILRNQQTLLNMQWQDRHRQQAHLQQIDQDSVLLKNHYGSQLQLLRQPISLAMVLTHISLLAKAQTLQLTALKSVQNQAVYDLHQDTIHVDIMGKEPHLMNFIHSLMQQHWLCDIQQLQFNTVTSGIRLQATLDVYHASR